MASVDCFSKLRDSFPDIKEPELKAILDELNNAKSKLFKPGTTDFSAPEFRKAAQRLLAERRFQNYAARVQSARQLLEDQKLFRDATHAAFKDRPVEALKAAIGGGEASYTRGGNNSIRNVAKGLEAGTGGQLVMELEKLGVMDTMASGTIDRDVAQEMAKPGSTGSELARNTAKVLQNINDTMLRAKQLAGSAVRKLEGFITHTVHDAVKVAAVPFEEWFGKLFPKLDRERTFGVWNDNQIRDAMQEDYNRIIGGKFDSNVLDEIERNNSRPGSMANRIAQSRTYHFKDGYAWHDYNAEFGNKTLLQSIVSDISRSSKQVALMNKLGPNPEQGWQNLIRNVMAHYERQGQADQVNAIKKAKPDLDVLWSTVRGTDDGPPSTWIGKTVNNLNAIQTMAHLGSSLLREGRTAVSTMMSLRSATGQSLLEIVHDMVHAYVHQTGDAAEQAARARDLSVSHHSLLNQLYEQAGAGQTEPGAMSKTLALFYKLTGLEGHFNKVKNVAAELQAADLGGKSHLPYLELDPRTQLHLERYGIDSRQWDGIRQAASDYSGGKTILPDDIDKVDVGRFGSERQRFQSKLNYVSMLNDMANLASNTPGDRIRAGMYRATSIDSWWGALTRLFFQFKGPAFQEMSTLKRTVFSQPGGGITNWGGALRNSSAMGTLAQFLTFATAAGYAGNVAADLVSGKTPQDPKKMETWSDAFVRGGAAGIYGDILAGNAKRGLLEQVAGPTFSAAGDAYKDFYQPLKQGDTKKLAPNAFRFAKNNMPGHNLFWAKGALDHLIFDNIQESIQPGYKLNLLEHAQKSNQSYWFPPSE